MTKKKSIGDKEFQDIINDFSDHFQKLVSEWKGKQVGSMASWMGLFQSIMEKIQLVKGLPGLVKADICIEVISSVAQSLINTNAASLSEDQLNTVKMILTKEGAGILRGATSVIKGFMRSIDSNGDEEITMDELKDFFCGCCGIKEKKKKQNKQ